MKTPQGPSLFSKQTSINTYIVQTSPGTPTPVCWTQWLDCGLSRKTHHWAPVYERSTKCTVHSTMWPMWLEIHYKCTVHSTVQYSTQYSTCGWKYITSVQYSTKLFCLEKKQPVQIFGLEKKQPNFEKFLQVQIPHTPGVYKRSTNIQNAFKTSDDLSSWQDKSSSRKAESQ